MEALPAARVSVLELVGGRDPPRSAENPAGEAAALVERWGWETSAASRRAAARDWLNNASTSACASVREPPDAGTGGLRPPAAEAAGVLTAGAGPGGSVLAPASAGACVCAEEGPDDLSNSSISPWLTAFGAAACWGASEPVGVWAAGLLPLCIWAKSCSISSWPTCCGSSAMWNPFLADWAAASTAGPSAPQSL